MNTTKTVFNKLYSKKTELETHKIELGAIDKIEKQFTESKQILNKRQAEKKEFINLDTIFKKADTELSNLLTVYTKNRKEESGFLKELNNNFKLLDKAAKDLGVDITNIPAYKKYLESRENYKKSSDINQSNWEIVSKYK
jgi:arginine deiminase